MTARPFPILFITSTRIGDAVLSSGLLARLHDEIPRARFTVAAGPLAAPLFRDTPRLDGVIALEKKAGSLHWVDLWKRVRGTRWGLILDLRGSGLSNTVSAKMRLVRKSPEADAPVVHKVVELARLLDLEAAPPAPHLFVSAETQAEADRRLGPGGPSWRWRPQPTGSARPGPPNASPSPSSACWAATAPCRTAGCCSWAAPTTGARARRSAASCRGAA
jgi:hypothetical protein